MILFLYGNLENNEPIYMIARANKTSMIGDALFAVTPNRKFLEIKYKEIYKEMKEKGFVEL